MLRWALALMLAVVALVAITANAASLSVGGGAQAFQVPIEFDLPPAPPGGVDCDIDWHRQPIALLEWDAVPGADAYRVEHRGPFSSYHPLTQVDGETTELGLNPSFLRHRYRVSAEVDGSAGGFAESRRVHCKPRHTYHLGGRLRGSEHHSVRYASLDWPDDDVSVGYVVLRSTTSGGPYEIVGAPLESEYVDAPIADGVTFYYRVIGIDGSGMESEPSNEVAIVDETAPVSPEEAEDSAAPEADPSPEPTPAPTTEVPATTDEPAPTLVEATPAPEPTATALPVATPDE